MGFKERMIRKIISNVHNFLKRIELAFRQPKYNSKVFCIGYNKTGTTTLGKSLEMLGYRHSSFNKKVWRKFYKNNEIVKILKYTAKLDSVDDLPWLKEDMIPILDRVFPNSKFIYLTRDESSWKKSLYNWRYKIKGTYPDIKESLKKFRKHKDFVLDYFKDRPTNQFIVLDIKDGDGFKKLADFLGKKTTRKKFPHYNKTSTIANRK